MSQPPVDEIQVLRDARPTVPQYPAQDRARARAALLDAAQAGPAAGAGQPGRWLTWRASPGQRASWRRPRSGGAARRDPGQMSPGRRRRGLLAGGSAIVAAVAVAVTLALLPGSAARPSLPPLPGPTGPSAVTLLAQAAATAARQPGSGGIPGPGRYAYNAYVVGNQNSGSYNGRPVKSRDPNAYCPSQLIQEWMPARLVWRGHYRYTQVGGPHCTWSGSYPLSVPGTMPGWESNLLTWRGLPTNPAALKRVIASRYGSSTDPGGFGSPSADAYRDPYALFYIASRLLSFDAPPALRAALFEVMERLPGVENLGPASDQLGRHGVAVGITKEYSGHMYRGVFRDVFIFDPTTSTGLKNTVTSYEYPRASPGILRISTNTRVYEAAGVVDSPTATLPVAGSQAARG